MDKEQAKAAADRAEELADLIETPTHPPELAASIVALLLCPPGEGYRVVTSHKTGQAGIVDAKGGLALLRFPFAGTTRGTVARDFMTSPALAITLVERVFDGWGYDIVKWTPGAVPDIGTSGDGEPLPVFDAEVSPPFKVDGHALVGQHTTFAGALYAAALRGYAFKVKKEAGLLEMADIGTINGIDVDVSDVEKGLIVDIADRAEELGMIDGDERLPFMIDVAAVHRGGCPLMLEHWLHATTDFDFAHDVKGIRERIDRTTGQLTEHWVPRCAMSETDAEVFRAQQKAAKEPPETPA